MPLATGSHSSTTRKGPPELHLQGSAQETQGLRPCETDAISYTQIV